MELRAVWRSARARMKSTLAVGALATMLAPACGGSPASSPSSSLSVGDWNGTTAQRAPIAMTVSSNETLTAITVGYSFNGCSGTQTFSNLNVPTAPNVTCIPGPCSDPISSYRAFAYSSSSDGTRSGTSINGLFLPGGQAQGRVTFRDLPSCGTAEAVEWTATRR